MPFRFLRFQQRQRNVRVGQETFRRLTEFAHNKKKAGPGVYQGRLFWFQE